MNATHESSLFPSQRVLTTRVTWSPSSSSSFSEERALSLVLELKREIGCPLSAQIPEKDEKHSDRYDDPTDDCWDDDHE